MNPATFHAVKCLVPKVGHCVLPHIQFELTHPKLFGAEEMGDVAVAADSLQLEAGRAVRSYLVSTSLCCLASV
jgi:hypothetical protein